MNKALNKRIVIVNIRNSLKRFYADESSQNYDELKESMKDVYTIQGNLDEEMKKIEERIKSARENLVKIKADKENFDTIQKQFEYISRAFKEQSNNEDSGFNANSDNEDNGDKF
jgi:DNA anti-recombination protein RmuC